MVTCSILCMVQVFTRVLSVCKHDIIHDNRKDIIKDLLETDNIEDIDNMLHINKYYLDVLETNDIEDIDNMLHINKYHLGNKCQEMTIPWDSDFSLRKIPAST